MMMEGRGTGRVAGDLIESAAGEPGPGDSVRAGSSDSEEWVVVPWGGREAIDG
jgi:hypothetical protein